MIRITALFFVVSLSTAAQPYEVPQVPHKLNFAGITLTIRDDARREIQKDVDALWQSPRHFNIKVERAKTYFPIIEKIFAEERVPDDFKYLVLQESALIADAVSVSNAVGFWQFKDFTALEMGLRVDDTIDERMNIASATRGAARYIKKNNYQFNNWVYALQAYQMGAGGVSRSVKDTESGAKHMNITSGTYWYVKKFLAHKIAFETAVSGKPQQPISAIESKGQQSLQAVAADLSINPEELLAYNKWIRKGTIPNDRSYAIVVPLPENKLPAKSHENTVASKAGTANASIPFIFINGVPALKAVAGENMTSLAKRAGVSLPAFMSYNDLQGHEKIQSNVHYFTAHKKAKAEKSQAIAGKNDNLWTISQLYGVSLKKLKKYNRTESISLQEGQPIWMDSKMPKNLSKTTTHEETVTTDDRYFTWGVVLEDTSRFTTQVQPSSDEAIIPPAEANPNPFESETTVLNQPLVTVPSHHIVQSGENIYSIARLYELSPQNLINWNQLGENLNLSPGQRLNLIESQTITEKTVPQELIHEVQANDTLYGIARSYNVTIKELMEWNGKTVFSVTVGEKLKVIKK